MFTICESGSPSPQGLVRSFTLNVRGEKLAIGV